MQEGLLGDEEGRSASSPRTRRILGLVAVVAVVASVSCTATYFATRPQGCDWAGRGEQAELSVLYVECGRNMPWQRVRIHIARPRFPSTPLSLTTLHCCHESHPPIRSSSTSALATNKRRHARTHALSVQAGGSPQWTGGSRVRPWHGVRPSLELRGPARVPSSVPFRHPALRTAHRKRPRPRRPEQGYESGLESVKGYYLKHPTPPQT